MNWLRNALIGAILVVVYILFIRWDDFQSRQQPNVADQNAPAAQVADNDLPAAQPAPSTNSDIPSAAPTPEQTGQPIAKSGSGGLVEVHTDVLNVVIDTRGGDIVKVTLPKYAAELDKPEVPLTLLNKTPSHTYIARSGIVGDRGTDSTTGRPTYSVSQSEYTLSESADSLSVDLKLQKDGITFTKRYNFSRDSYLIDVQYLVQNNSDSPWTGTFFGQIMRDGSEPSYGYFGMQPYLGAAITTPDSNYEKVEFDDLDDEPFKVQHSGGWVAMIQHYFISAWIPPENATNSYNLYKSSASKNYVLSFTTATPQVAPGSSGSVGAEFYVGPKHIRDLEKISPHLDLTIDYSWLWFIAKPLFFVMDWFHSLVGNWGVAIILLTALIKLVFLYPSALSYRSMAKMRKLQPKMAELKERYGDDRQRMSQEVMKMYQREKVNPFGGCLPVLMQMPVFISLYWVIMESVELRHSPFMLWIQDLSQKDPYFILPLLMGASMFIQQKLNPTPPDPMQARIMQLMPIFFTFLFMMFPAGLVLYWVVNNTLSIIQQYLITRQIEKADK